MKRIPLADFNKDPFDVVVIGAGINGSGAAQQLAACGYRVLTYIQHPKYEDFLNFPILFQRP